MWLEVTIFRKSSQSIYASGILLTPPPWFVAHETIIIILHQMIFNVVFANLMFEFLTPLASVGANANNKGSASYHAFLEAWSL